MKLIILARNAIRLAVLKIQYFVYRYCFKMDIAASARISFGTRLDKTYPRGIHIGEESYFASGAIMFSHDYARQLHCDTYIGKHCFIGADAIILPGLRIGDEVIVGAGAVVSRDVPSNCIVAGNPARVIRENIHTTRFGQLVPETRNQERSS